MNVTYDGGTGQQRAMFQDALSYMMYPWDSMPVNVTVSWPVEPSLPGHKEYACTTTADGTDFALEIRRSLDTDVSRSFYIEVCAHELAHVIAFHYIDPTTIVGWFYRLVSGDGKTVGTVPDIDPTDKPWEDRLQEGLAEVLKDALLPEQYRVYDNRTNWFLDESHYPTLMGEIINQIPGGPGVERVRAFAPPESDPTMPIPVFVGPGLAYDTTTLLSYLKVGEGYPRVRYAGVASSGPVSGLRDFPTFWTPHPEGSADGRLLDVEHRQSIAFVGIQVSDVGANESPQVVVTDAEGPPEGIPPEAYRSLTFVEPTIHDFHGWVLLSQFEPDPIGTIPPWPYTDPGITAGGGEWASVRFRTR